MSELRWNPVLEEWVITATSRQGRPLQLSKNQKKPCLLCPKGFEVPDEYDICVFENRFPSFMSDPPQPIVKGDSLYRVRKAEGVCEVVLYSSRHNSILAKESEAHILKLINVWSDRFKELGAKSSVKYVFIFENKGEAIGVSLSHPHGQIYAFPYIPPIIQKELSSSRRYMAKNKRCLFCDILKKETKAKKRIIKETKYFSAFIPFYARWPYEVHIYSKFHRASILEFSQPEKKDLSGMLKSVLTKYDALFKKSFPFMMVMHQAPTDGKKYPHCHFHIEFYSPVRSRDKIKYLAGCESGAGSFINDTSAEEKAEELRKAK